MSFAEGSRKKKDIFLTQAGEIFCDSNIRKLLEAETRAVSRLNETERREFLRLYEQLLSALEQEKRDMR